MNISSFNSVSESRQDQSLRSTGRFDRSGLGDLEATKQALGQPLSEQAVRKEFGQTLPVSAASQSASVQYRQQREFELELITRDGDKVTVRVFAEQEGGVAVSRSRVDGDGYSARSVSVEAEQKQRSSFAFSVDGELDADELSAINDLMGQINRVADEFFNGDVLKSFEQLQDIGFDTSEIAGYSLELEQRAQVEISYREAAVQRYRDVAGEDGPRPGLGLGRYVSALGSAFDRAGMLEDAPRQLGRLITEVLRPNIEVYEPENDDEQEQLSRLGRAQLMNAQLLEWISLERSQEVVSPSDD